MNTINLNKISANLPSICIPRVFPNITRERILRIFNDLNLGVISHIDIIYQKTDKEDSYNRVYVHMYEWSNTHEAASARLTLLAGKELKIIYDDPWFWKVTALREHLIRAQSQQQQQQYKKPHIVYEIAPTLQFEQRQQYDGRQQYDAHQQHEPRKNKTSKYPKSDEVTNHKDVAPKAKVKPTETPKFLPRVIENKRKIKAPSTSSFMNKVNLQVKQTKQHELEEGEEEM